MNVQTKKTILSVGGGYDVFRFFDMDTKLLEIEDATDLMKVSLTDTFWIEV